MFGLNDNGKSCRLVFFMEIKKSYIADLERQKTTGFLLGLIVALALFFVGMELTTRQTTDSSDGLIDDMAQDLESLPVLDQKDMMAAAPPPMAMPVITENLVEVEEVQPLEAEKPVSEVQTETDGEGAAMKESQSLSAVAPVALDENDNPLNFRVVEELPEFPGGMVAFMKWLTKNLKYPATARSQKIQGKVVVHFIVNKDGSVTDAQVKKSVEASLDREALRVVSMMPKWTPGKMHGEVCRTLFAIPIEFKI